MRTEVKLNDIYYKLTRLPTQTLANQMASKVGQGTSEYADLTTWSAWIQEDWQEGVGKLKPHRGGGFLYGEAESRVPGQLILPQYMQDRKEDNDGEENYGTPTGQITVGTGGYVRAAVEFTTTGGTILAAQKFWIYASIKPGAQLTFAIYSNTAGSPNALITSTTYTPPETNVGYYWHGVSLTASGLVASTLYHLVVYPTSGSDYFYWAVSITGTAGSQKSGDTYNGSAWSPLPAGSEHLSFLTNFAMIANTATNSGAGFFRYGTQLHCYSNNYAWSFDTGTLQWGQVGAITGITAITGGTYFDDRVYFGNVGGDGDYTTLSGVNTFIDTGLNGTVFTKFKGLLWRAYANFVEYSEDGTTWEPTATFGDPIYVTDESDSVTGLCGMGELMYAATTNGLVPIYPGDAITGGITWGSSHAQNGMRMTEFEGALYILVNGRVVRYTEDGSMQDVWMNRDDDALVGRIGRVWDITKVNNWLFVIVDAVVTNGKPTIWAYQNNSWHHIATLPNSTSSVATIASDFGIYYDRPTSLLWAITPDFVTYNWYIPDYSLNPFNDPASKYVRSAWIEWDWFDGPILEAPKDFESVTIMGENFSSTKYVTVYWKDDDSTAWELLGTCDSNIEELRWTIAMGTRPNTKRFKLGFLLFTSTQTSTPRIRAFRVKYHLMVSDWFRWNVQVAVEGRTGHLQMFADGTRNNLTASQIKSNIDTLAKRVPPFVYMDVDGTYYEVKITDANFAYTKWEYNEATSDTWWEGVYNLVLEQVTQGTYTPP